MQNMMAIKEDQLQGFTSFLIKNLLGLINPSRVYKFFDKKSTWLNKSSGSGMANEPNYQLANELHKPIIRKFKKRKVYSSFRDNIWGVDLADMQPLSKYNK